MRRIGMILSVLVLSVLMGCSSALQAQEAEPGDVVRVNYTLTLSDGTIADTSEGRAPLEFTLGAGDVVPGFDNGVTGLQVGESAEFTLTPAEGYGDPRPELVMELPRNPENEDRDISVGDTVYLAGPGNIPVPAKILELDDETVKLDANHPLAGEELNFAVELVEIVAEQDAVPDNSAPVDVESTETSSEDTPGAVDDSDLTGGDTEELPADESAGSEP
ncbi:MAG: peptidylprolyl isomerase [Cyanobacteria bacterium P01_E01_bin.45]